jgi:Ricin-type beta-trefoil lectin domain/Ricin-type beta-trefoil lectin domain-like
MNTRLVKLCLGLGALTALGADAAAATTGYYGFESDGGASQRCMVQDGNLVEAFPCDLDGIEKQNQIVLNQGQITINGLCVDVGTGANNGLVVLNPCGPSLTQSWVFYGGLIENQQTRQCIVDFGLVDENDNVGMGDCGALDTAGNLWMPIHEAMVLNAYQSSLALNDTAQNYNSPNNDTNLEPVNDNNSIFWEARIWKNSDGSLSTILKNTYNEHALDVYGANINSNGVGIVDMATANGTPAQTWCLNSEGTNPQGYTMITNGLGPYCLDVLGDNKSAGATVDLYLCNSQYGDGNNPGQLWQVTLDGFPDSSYL